jgi:hypothetical protein
MKYWIATPSAALGVAFYLAFAAPMAADRTDIESCVKVAAVETGIMSDACAYAIDGKSVAQCTAPIAAKADVRPTAMNWPGDFIMMTARAALDIWHGTLAVLAFLYDAVTEAGDDIV